MDGGALAQGPSYWQVGAALAAVLGLLVVVLRFLQRWQGAGGQGSDVKLLSVRRLGPRREVQVLRVGDRVHTIYRHDAAMVLLASEGQAEQAAAQPDPPAAPAPLGRRLRALVAAAGGTVRRAVP